MKTGRKKAREDALQILYQLDLNHDLTPEGGIRYFEKHFMLPAHNQEVGQFTHRLVSGVTERLSEIDSRLSDFADNWKTGRMPAVDRNILRLGVYELVYCDDVPSTVTINEMIELAKCFGAEESCAFVNGVLDKLSRNTVNPNKAK